MCRWIVYTAADSAALQLGDLLSRPRHCLITQAYRAGSHPGFSAKNNAELNADGFGVTWYSPAGRPFSYKSISPAWSDANLADLCQCISSHVIFAHVRAATPGSVVSHENCHPFKHGRLAMMHNGHVENFPALRRALLARLSDEAFHAIKGGTDSEHLFALVLTLLREPSRSAPFAPQELGDALVGAIRQVLELLREAGVVGGFTSLNCALTDGVTCVSTRFCDNWPAVPPPSLYFAFPTVAELAGELRGGAGGATAGPGDGTGSAAGVAGGGGGGGAAAVALPPQQQPPQPQPPQSPHTPQPPYTPQPQQQQEQGQYSAEYTRRAERWAQDEAYLASMAPTASGRVLLIASEPCGPGLAWVGMPANSLLVHATGSGQAPTLTRLEGLLQLPLTH
jgi:glutamine amidotransferase